METAKTIGLVIPAYNEARGIARTVDEARAYFRSRGYAYDIVVCADGDDGTREAVAELARTDPAVRAFGGPGRRGKGRGVREGMGLAKGGVLGFIDADNKTPIGEFDKVAPLLEGGAPVVIGSRSHADSRIEKVQPLYRRLGSRGFGAIARRVVDLADVKDTQCGFKFFSRKAAETLFGLQTIDGYLFDVEILCLARALGLPIAQVPVRWRDDGDSRLQVFSGNVRNLIDLFRIRGRIRRLGEEAQRNSKIRTPPSE